MKTIRLKFTDFWKGFDVTNNIFLDYLKQHYYVVLSDNPDYIIYSAFGHDYLKYDCIRIFFTCENIRPDFNLCDYALAFDWMTFEDRYVRFPVYMLYAQELKNAMLKHEIADAEISKKHKFCNFIYSNPNAHYSRAEFFRLLSTYKKVDSGGRYLNNLGYCVKDKLEFMKGYKFSIAFENSSASGYTTEKIVQAFAAKTVPIYWGNPNIASEFNHQAFINCHEYDCFEAVTKKIMEVDTNDDLYQDILKTPIYKNVDGKAIPSLISFNSFLDNIFCQEANKAVRREKSPHGTYYEKLRFLILNSR